MWVCLSIYLFVHYPPPAISRVRNGNTLIPTGKFGAIDINTTNGKKIVIGVKAGNAELIRSSKDSSKSLFPLQV